VVHRSRLLLTLDEAVTQHDLRGGGPGRGSRNRRIGVVGGVQLVGGLQLVFKAGSRGVLAADRFLQVDDEVRRLVVLGVLGHGYLNGHDGRLDFDLLELGR